METREAPSDAEEETLESPSDLNEEMQEAPLDPEEKRVAPPYLEEETREAPSDSEENTNNLAGLAVGSTELETLVVPALRLLTINGTLPPNNVIVHVESMRAANFSADARRR